MLACGVPPLCRRLEHTLRTAQRRDLLMARCTTRSASRKRKMVETPWRKTEGERVIKTQSPV
eukprot:2477951-Pleurochrysis_carterae.AAC.2